MPWSTAIVWIACALLSLSCNRPPPSEEAATPTRPDLSFTVEGAGFGTTTFGPALEDMRASWVYDPAVGRTRVHLSGQRGDWRAGLDLTVPLSAPGRYRADASYGGMDRAFAVALADHRTGERIALIAVDAVLDLDASESVPEILSGRFSGRFAVGARTTGRDILQTPPEKRTYATIRDGRFRAPYRDTLHGRGDTWSIPRDATPDSSPASRGVSLPPGPDHR